MSKTKRLISWLAAVLLIFTMMPITAFGAPDAQAGKGKFVNAFEINNAGISAISVAGKSIDIEWSSDEAGTLVHAWDTNHSDAQRFSFIPMEMDGNGRQYYSIMSVCSGLNLDVMWGDVSAGNLIQQWYPNGTDAQLFSVQINPNGGYWISPKESDLVFDLQWGIVENGTNIQLWDKNDTVAQQFMIDFIRPTLPDGIYTFSPNNSELLLDAQWAGTENGTNVWLHDANGTPAQEFMISFDYNNGYYNITNVASGLALDVEWGSVASGTNVHLWERNGSHAQNWAIVAGEMSSFTLYSAIGGNVLDAQWGGTEAETNVWVHEPNGTAAQSWGITLKPEPIALSIYDQVGENERVLKADYSMSELTALSSSGFLGYITSGSGDMADEWRYFGTNSYVTIENLLSSAYGATVPIANEDAIRISAGESSPNGGVFQELSGEVYNAATQWFPATKPGTLIEGADIANAETVLPVLSFSTILAAPITTTAGADLMSADWSTATASTAPQFLIGLSQEAYLSGNAEAASMNRFTSYVDEITIKHPEPPAPIVFSVSAEIGNGDAEEKRTFTAEELAAVAMTNPIGFLQSGDPTWTTFATGNYVTIDALVAAAGENFAAGDSITVINADGTASKTYNYEQVQDSSNFFPNATPTDHFSTADAVTVGSVIALDYVQSSGFDTAGAVVSNIANYPLFDQKHFFIGASEPDYVQGNLGADRLLADPAQLVITHPEPEEKILIINSQSGVDGTPTDGVGFSEAELNAMTVSEPKMAYLQSGNPDENPDWRIWGTNNYVDVMDLITAAGETFTAGDSITISSMSDDPVTFTYDQFMAAGNFYPAATSYEHADATGAVSVAPVIAMSYLSASPFTSSAEFLETVGVETVWGHCFLIGASEADYLAGTLGAERLVEYASLITITHP